MSLRFFDHGINLMKMVAKTQENVIAEAAGWIAESLMAGGVWHIFGTGHSHILGEEAYFRAGGLAAVNAILFPALMQHEGPVSSTRLERLPGLAQAVLSRHDLRRGEVLTIVSNSGRNAVPVEAALVARELGLRTVAITSMSQTMAAPPSPLVGRRLCEVCDLVIDNGGNQGDAVFPVGSGGLTVAATSSLVGIAIIEEIVLRVAEIHVESGKEPPCFKSANLPGGDEWNAGLIERYRGRVNLR